MLTAEKMYEKGFGMKTFKVEKECRIIKSSLTRRTVFNMHPERLWEYIARELTAGQNSKTQKYLAFLSCTYWDGQNLHGHVALGGGGLALFGTGCLYTWPSKLEEVLPCFMNMAKVDTGTLLDDSCFRYYGLKCLYFIYFFIVKQNVKSIDFTEGILVDALAQL